MGVWGAVGAGFLFPFLSLVLSFLVVTASAVSTRIIRAPPPYRLVNAESCDYKKNKKKNKFIVPIKFTHMSLRFTTISYKYVKRFK